MVLCRKSSHAMRQLCRHLHRDVRVRFAPSPTGQLHIGGYRTALYNYMFAKKHGGAFILRLEDTDQTRLVPGAAEQMEKTLEWGLLCPDESPFRGGSHGPYTQSQRLEIYKNAVDELMDKGHAYRCFCTEKRLELLRKEAARNRTRNKYDGRCRNLSKDEISAKLSDKIPCTIRFKLDSGLKRIFDDLIYGPVEHDPYENEGDPIIMKSDGYPTYHLANVVDDHHMEISHVFRGVEWQVSTPKHIMMYNAFKWEPPKFGHLPLIVNPDGTKLSKRQGDIHVEHFRHIGYFPEALLNFVTLSGGGFNKLHANCDGVSDEAKLWQLEEIIEAFEIEQLCTSPAQMDLERLDKLNRNVIAAKMTDPASLKNLLQEAKKHLSSVHGSTHISDDQLVELLRWGRITKISDLSTHPDFLFLWSRPETLKGIDASINAEAVLQAILFIEEKMDFHLANDAIRKMAKSKKVPYAALMKCLRIFLSGQADGPPVKDMLHLLGKQEAVQRLQRGLEVVKKMSQR